jgi:predicted patatin/cPLA2 family phospholipase
LHSATGEIANVFTEGIIASMQANRDQVAQSGSGQKIPYRALTLSGGGSRGAYGAGLLTGWTERGDRPEFDIVTGISTGALMATHAFLGPEFDDELAIIKTLTNDDVFERHGRLATLVSAVRSAAGFSTEPLRKTLRSFIDEETLDRVAEQHRLGRRLYVGSTNLDANSFTIWDMGVIARSDRPDRLNRYIDAIMASAAFPIAFPPVFIEVEGEDGTFTEMHVDGGVRETAFFFEYHWLQAFRQAFEDAGLSNDDFQQEGYLLVNGQLNPGGSSTYSPVAGKIGPVIAATVNSLMAKATQGSIFRLWVLAMAHGADFHVTFIPSDYELASSSLEFNPLDETALFEYGYQQAIDGTAWATQKAPDTTDEFIDLLINSIETMERSTPAWLLRRSSPD